MVVKQENQTTSQDTEEKYKVIETSDGESLEDLLNEEPGWKLHSLSAASNPQKKVIIAVLEKQDIV